MPGRRAANILTLSLMLGLSRLSVAWAGNFPGEQPAYIREVGLEQHFFYGTSGGALDQIEYICRAFAGTIGSDDTSSSVWQVQRFTYNSGGQITDIEFAGDDDAYTNSCASRSSLNYD